MEMSFCLPCEVDRARNIPATPCTSVVWCHQNEVNTISLCFRLSHTMMNNWYQRAQSNTLMKNCSSFIFRDTVLNYLPHVNSIDHSWSWYKRAKFQISLFRPKKLQCSRDNKSSISSIAWCNPNWKKILKCVTYIFKLNTSRHIVVAFMANLVTASKMDDIWESQQSGVSLSGSSSGLQSPPVTHNPPVITPKFIIKINLLFSKLFARQIRRRRYLMSFVLASSQQYNEHYHIIQIH